MSKYLKQLNPIYKDLETLIKYLDISPKEELETEEYDYLKYTSSIINTKFKYLLNRLKELEIELEIYAKKIEDETGDDKKDAVGLYNKVLKEIKNKIDRINKELDLIDSPYFGKIKFSPGINSDFKSREITTYIGKFAYFDENTNKPLITDWRAPISNLYYTNSGPTDNVSFNSPLGLQKGNLTQKRMFEISHNRIHSIYDAKTGNTAADSFLLSQLKKKIGKKLQDIVSTIQESQNRIIRDSINKFTIIQGVAGSGKTTIVLHRIAYLFFTFQKEINPEKTLIIAPNSMFLDYISDVLPSLGVSNVEANTYLFWAKKILGWDNKYILNPDRNINVERYKGQREYLEKILKAYKVFEDNIINNIPYSRSDRILTSYYEIKRKNPNISLNEGINLAINAVEAQNQFSNRIIGSAMGNNFIDKDIRLKISQYLKKSLNAYNAYREILNIADIPTEVKEYTKRYVKGGKVQYYEQEDLSMIVILHVLINGNTDILKDYIIADEAQDMSYSQIYSLSLITRRNNLMLAGDLAQSIFDPVYIKSWEDVIDTLKTNKDSNMEYEYFTLSKSYRTTIEIIDFAVKTLEKYFPKEYQLPEAVLRHGEIPKIIEYNNIDELEDILEKDISISNTIAVICTDDNHAIETYNKLKELDNIKKSVISFKEDDFKNGILVLPITKAKGLEFDSVYIMDVDNIHYDTSSMSIRRYYVASTRALHRLNIVIDKSKKKSELIDF